MWQEALTDEQSAPNKVHIKKQAYNWSADKGGINGHCSNVQGFRNLVKEHLGNKKNFLHPDQQQKDKGSVSLLLGGIRDLVTKDRKKAEVFNGTSSLAFICNTSAQESQVLESSSKV